MQAMTHYDWDTLILADNHGVDIGRRQTRGIEPLGFQLGFNSRFACIQGHEFSSWLKKNRPLYSHSAAVLSSARRLRIR